MPNKYKDILQQLLWNLLEEKERDLGTSKFKIVLKDYLKKDKADRTPKIEKISLPDLEKKADSVFSKWIIKRDGHCVTCGSRRQPNNGHLFKRGRQLLRFNEFNCNRQCEPCNSLHNNKPEIYKKWFIGKYGQEKYDELETLSRQLKTWTVEEYEAIIANYDISKV